MVYLPILLLCLWVAICVITLDARTEGRQQRNVDESLVLAMSLQNDTKYLLLELNRLGLANRLRSMADWYTIAAKHGRELIVRWIPSPECNAEYETLFEAGPEHFHVLGKVPSSLPAHSSEKDSLAATEATASSLGKTFIFMDEDAYPRGKFVYADNLFASDVDVIMTTHDGVATSESSLCQYYLHKRSLFYRSLQPIREIKEIISNVLDEFSDSLQIGVHIRAHDSMYDWNIVPPTGDSQSAEAFGESATLNDFISVMSGIDEKFTSSDKRGQTRKTAKFYIASNDEGVKESVLNTFPNTIALHGNHNRNNNDGIQFALVEWYVLAHSALVLHTHTSSFAEEAAAVYERPLLAIWGHAVLHKNNPLLPQCGHMQYMNAYATDFSSARFTEGTVDNRVVDTKVFALKEVDMFKGWGVPVAYASVQGR
jgi:hypothetical protein